MLKKFWVLVVLLTIPLLETHLPAAASEVIATDSFGQSISAYKGSYALLIGVGEYTSSGWSNLTNIATEMKQLRQSLQGEGYLVKVHLNPTQSQLRSHVDDFISEFGISEDNRLFIMYSGHGWTIRDVGYLVPSDAPDPIIDETGFIRRSISMHEVMTWARRVESRHALFVFDSCFSGTLFETRSRFAPTITHLAHVIQKPVRQFLTAGDSNQIVPAKSLFLPLLIRGLAGC